MASILIALWACSLVEPAGGEPTLSFPFNAQLPPVARIDQFFSYSFSPNTFQSKSSITYSLADHPKWLSIDGDSGRLYGTPDNAEVPPGEIVGQNLGLIATDNTGSTTANATLVVSRDQGPSVQIPLARQIASFGPFSAPSTLLLYPSIEFEYIFDPETFSTPHGLNYYATSTDNSPLPSWLHFDADRLRFSGKTPAFKTLVQPPQIFDINLVASDIVGFSGAWISFSIVVGSHQLTTDAPVITLNVTKGAQLRYDSLHNGVRLDNKTVTPGDLSVSIDNMPTWLSYDVDKGRLQGTPKDDDHSTNFTINFRDSLQDTLSVLVAVNVQTGLFLTTFSDVQARPGEFFNLDLRSYLRDSSDISIDIQVDQGQDWLKADSLNLTGTVPKDSKGVCNVMIDATSRKSGLKERETLHISFLAADGTVVSLPPSTGSSSRSSGVIGDSLERSADQGSRQHTTGRILLATLIPLLFLSFCGLLFVCSKRRRQHVRRYVLDKRRDIASAHALTGMRRMKVRIGSSWRAQKTAGTCRPKLAWFRKRDRDSSEESSEAPTSLSSSETMRSMSILEAPPAILASGRRSRNGGQAGHLSPGFSRESWITIEGTVTPTRSERSVQTDRAAAHLPSSIHGGQNLIHPKQYTDVTDVMDGASYQTVDMSTVSLEDISRMQPLAPAVCNRQNSVDEQTARTSSSAALPASYWRHHRLLAHIPGRWPLFPAPLRTNREAPSIGEDATVTRSSQQPRNSCPILFRASLEPSNDRQSVLTASSFASTENWRTMAWQETSKRLVGQPVSHHPLRPVSPLSITEPASEDLPRPVSPLSVAGPDEMQSPAGPPGSESYELMSPSKWGDLGDPVAAAAGNGGGNGEGNGEGKGKADRDASRLTTPPIAGFEIDFDAKFMSDGREGGTRTIRTVLGENGRGSGTGIFI